MTSVDRTETESRPLGLKGPRADVVMELKGQGSLTAKDISARLGLSMNAVRHHMKELEAAGLVFHAREHRGVGAPAFVYKLTAAGAALFPQRYEDAVSRLLDHVVAREGRAAAVEVLEAKYRDLASTLAPILEAATPAERLEIVTRALAAEGYMPEFRPNGPDGHHLVEHNCPIPHVAERFPEVCEAEARFLAEVLVADITRGLHIASGCGTCEYQVRPVALGSPGSVGVNQEQS